jgi:hypothetical protein
MKWFIHANAAFAEFYSSLNYLRHQTEPDSLFYQCLTGKQRIWGINFLQFWRNHKYYKICTYVICILISVSNKFLGDVKAACD